MQPIVAIDSIAQILKAIKAVVMTPQFKQIERLGRGTLVREHSAASSLEPDYAAPSPSGLVFADDTLMGEPDGH